MAPSNNTLASAIVLLVAAGLLAWALLNAGWRP